MLVVLVLLTALGLLVGVVALLAAAVSYGTPRGLLAEVAAALSLLGFWVGLGLPDSIPRDLRSYGGGSLLATGTVIVLTGGLLPPPFAALFGVCWTLGPAFVTSAIRIAWATRIPP